MTSGDGEYIAFDLETTGLSASLDRVVEIGAVRFRADGTELGRFERLVNPERPMPPAARAIHGLNDTDLADAAPAREVLPAFLEFLGAAGAAVLLAHHAWFDAGFLGRELSRAGIARAGDSVVDTLALARRKMPELRNHRLDTLAHAFGLDPDGPHRALADGLRVKGLWLALGGPAEPPARLVAYPLYDEAQAFHAPVGWDRLAEAVVLGRRVRLEYDGGTRGPKPREVTPRNFFQRGGVTFLLALCHLDDLEKSFRLDRVRRYEVVALEADSCR